MKNIIFGLMLLTLSSGALAIEPSSKDINIGKQITLQSKVLQEPRELLI